MSGWDGESMGIELARPADPNDEWRISWNGRSLVTFAGPDARLRAELCYRELIARVEADDHAPERKAKEVSTNRGASAPKTGP